VEKGFFFDKGQARIINGDIFTTKKVAAGSIDLLITSPPYNVDIQYTSHDDRLTYDEYREFSRRWMKRCFTWLKDDGRFCLNIPLDKNRAASRVSVRISQPLQKRSVFRIIQRLYGMRGISRAEQHGDPGRVHRHRM
jgi:DNA modification methylase